MSEPALSVHEFDLLRRLVHQQIGVHLADSKRVLMESRLRRRLRELGSPTFLGYYRSLCDGSAPPTELQELVDSITTQTTSFFRERAHFDLLAREIAPSWARRVRRIRVWSAACSTGQEPYSLAAVVRAALPDHADIKVLATDVSLRALRWATGGRYPLRAIREIPERYRAFFRVEATGADRRLAAGDELRAMVVLRPLNLMAADYPFQGRFDAIFCRNVLIYFDDATKRSLVAKLARVLAPGGHLFLGMSESMVDPPPGLRPIGGSIYRSEG